MESEEWRLRLTPEEFMEIGSLNRNEQLESKINFTYRKLDRGIRALLAYRVMLPHIFRHNPNKNSISLGKVFLIVLISCINLKKFLYLNKYFLLISFSDAGVKL